VRLSERKLLVLTLVAIVVVVLGGGAWGYYRYSTSQDLQAQIKDLDDKIAERGRKAKTVAELKTLFSSEAFKKEEEAFNVHLPMESKTGDTDIWQMLNKIRKATHPQIIIRRVEPVVQRRGVQLIKVPKGVRAMLYRADIVGGFYDVLEYMSELENSDRIVRVEDFELAKRSSSGQDETEAMRILIDADITLVAFEYEPQSGAKPPPGGKSPAP
jgi:hypothetical protein